MSTTSAKPNLLLIDGIGPFFRHHKAKRINWSKIPFAQIETENGLRPECLTSIPEDFRTFVRRAKQLGYNGVTLDDVAHLVRCQNYPAALQAKIEAYRMLYGTLFEIAQQEGLHVYITMDVMFYNHSLQQLLGGSLKKTIAWLRQALAQLFGDFPTIAGIIMRFGETDGLDVAGDFQSRLVLKRPGQARLFLKQLLPMFEQHQRLLIFRTWSVGAYQIGDLIWNEQTFRAVFEGVDSSALVISMKYGESDFFRYLPLNRLFFVSDHQKIVEFQARREYEGFGAYPSFIGWDSESYVQQLKQAKNLVGASVWCQTGGWGKLRQLTFLRNSSPWVELNTSVLAKLWQGASCQEAVDAYVQKELPHVPKGAMLEFLRLSDEVIKELLYVRELAERQLFFRRLRLPPQLFVFWDRVIVDESMKEVLGHFVEDRQDAIREAHLALDKLRQMRQLAQQHGIPTHGLKFQLATFEILAAVRAYFFDPDNVEVAAQLEALKRDYKRRYKRSYSIRLDLDKAPLPLTNRRWLISTLLRDRSRYRVFDRVVTIRMLGWGYPLASRYSRRLGPKFVHQQAMGLGAIFK